MEEQVAALLGGIKVQTVSNRGWNPDELADRALDKIIYVGQQSDPAITAQALAFKERIRQVLVFYIHQAQASERTTICAELRMQGHDDMAEIISRMK